MPTPDEALELAQDDVQQGLSQFLNADPDNAGHGFRPLEEFDRDRESGGLGNGETGTFVVPWAFRGVHDGFSRDVMGFEPTRLEVEVRGVSILHTHNDGELQIARFIDWTAALAQIGVGFSKRPVVDSPVDAGLA